MYVECWTEDDGADVTLAPPENVKMFRERGLLTQNAVFQYAIYADTWADCMRLHHILQGWKPYVPFDEDDDGEGDEAASLRADAAREEQL